MICCLWVNPERLSTVADTATTPEGGPLDAAAIAGIRETLAARLKTLKLDGKIALRVEAALRSLATGERLTGVDGSYFERLIQVSYQAPDAVWTLNHEVIHALRDLGLLKSAEWTALRNAALADKAGMAEVRERYKGQGLSEEQLVEELVADRFADWHRGRAEKGFARDAFSRIREFIRALYSALTGNGFLTVEQVYRGIDSGRVGARGEAATDGAGQRRNVRRSEGKLDASVEARHNRAIAQGFLTQASWENMRDGPARQEIVGSGSKTDRVRPGDVAQTSAAGEIKRGADGAGERAADAAPKLAVFYHGTRDDIRAFDLNHRNRKDNGWLGTGVYLTESPEIANFYAMMKQGTGGERVMPLSIRLKNPYYATQEMKQKLRFAGRENIDAITDALKALGHDGVVLPYKDGAEVVVFDPANVRSPTAMFDPARSAENGLLFNIRRNERRAQPARPLSAEMPHSIGEALTDANLSLAEKLRHAGSRDAIAKSWDGWRTSVQDRFLPLLRAEAMIEQATGKPLPASARAYRGEELMTGKIGWQMERLTEDMVEPFYNDLHARKTTLDEVEAYVYARHAWARGAGLANPGLRVEELTRIVDVLTRGCAGQ